MKVTENLLRKTVEVVGQQPPILHQDELHRYVEAFQKQGRSFLAVCRHHGSPLYIFDESALLERARQFTIAFKSYFNEFRAYFAVKSNNHPALAASMVDAGLGLDVSSGPELELGLGCGCRDILFSGPGKTEAELRLAAEHPDVVTVLIDSFGELDRLEKASRSKGCRVRTGVRLCTDEQGLWRKFGISLSSLPAFMEAADKCPHVDVMGLQFHTSWNLHPDRQTAFIARLGENLQRLPPRHLTALQFVDIGGGYWPSRGEWLRPAGTPAGRLLQLMGSQDFHPTEHYREGASKIETFAREIATAMKAHIFPLISCGVKAEPGRWLCDDAMHILLTVVDKKTDDLVITDGGTNIIGWERFETDYAPVTNLTRPSAIERECLILGSLCTPHDIWGYSYFGESIAPGDVLLVPGQGAYTYSLRQEFIKPLPKIVRLPCLDTEKQS